MRKSSLFIIALLLLTSCEFPFFHTSESTSVTYTDTATFNPHIFDGSYTETKTNSQTVSDSQTQSESYSETISYDQSGRESEHISLPEI